MWVIEETVARKSEGKLYCVTWGYLLEQNVMFCWDSVDCCECGQAFYLASIWMCLKSWGLAPGNVLGSAIVVGRQLMSGYIQLDNNTLQPHRKHLPSSSSSSRMRFFLRPTDSQKKPPISSARRRQLIFSYAPDWWVLPCIRRVSKHTHHLALEGS